MKSTSISQRTSERNYKRSNERAIHRTIRRANERAIERSGRRRKDAQGVAILDRGIRAGLFPEARPRGTTPRVGKRFTSETARRPEAIPLHPRLSGDMRGLCSHSHPRLWRPIMAMNFGLCPRKSRTSVEDPRPTRRQQVQTGGAGLPHLNGCGEAGAASGRR